jgi:phosphoribosylaminoimidazolecarboxamide formyltransferase/IMP cyclohydrolase
VTHQWRLKYGLNPYQGDAAAIFPDGEPWLEVLNGQVGYINLLDALRAWTLARELAASLGSPSATSVKHVHPAGAAVARTIDSSFRGVR